MKLKDRILSLLLVSVVLVSWVHARNQDRIIVQTDLKPIKKVYPEYPEQLKKEGVAARFLVSMLLKRDGTVSYASVWLSQYPELKELLVEAFQQWQFEPHIHRGEPIRSQGFATVIFLPGDSGFQNVIIDKPADTTKTEQVGLLDSELQEILDRCSDYCQKLSNYALHYVCLEKIDQKLKIVEETKWWAAGGNPDLHSSESIVRSHPVLSLKTSDKSSSVYDYQMVRKQGQVTEKRILLGRTGESITEKNEHKNISPSYQIQPVLMPLSLLGYEQRLKFSYSLTGEDNLRGKRTFIIEAIPRYTQSGNIHRAQIWVDKENYSIMQVQVETSYVTGYEEVYEECSKFFLMPHLTITHHFENEKNGILFPSRSVIRIEYSGFLRTKKELKSNIDVTYSNYRFFTVDVDHDIIKKKVEEFFLRYKKNKLTFDYPRRALPGILIRYQLIITSH